MEPTLRRATTEMSPFFLCPAAVTRPEAGERGGGGGGGAGGGGMLPKCKSVQKVGSGEQNIFSHRSCRGLNPRPSEHD